MVCDENNPPEPFLPCDPFGHVTRDFQHLFSVNILLLVINTLLLRSFCVRTEAEHRKNVRTQILNLCRVF